MERQVSDGWLRERLAHRKRVQKAASKSLARPDV